MRRTKKERLELELTAAGLDMLADERERSRAARAEASRLTKFMKVPGAQLVAEDIPGLGRVYRTPTCSTPPFGAATVEKWFDKAKRTPPTPEH